MTRQLTTHRTPPLTHHRMRTAGIATAAVAIAIGAYGITDPLGPDARSPQPTGATAPARAIPAAQPRQEMRDATVGLYGDPAIASANATREMRHTITHLYGPTTNTAASARAKALREMRHTINHLYGRAR
jgi:hypothetical protein